MPAENNLLTDLHADLTSALHRRLITAYLKQPQYGSLLATCISEIEARIDEIDNADSAGVPGLQPEE